MESILRHSRKSDVGVHIALLSFILLLTTLYGCGDSGSSGSGQYYRLTNQRIEAVSPWFVNGVYNVTDKNGDPVTDVPNDQVVVLENGNSVDPATAEVKIYKRNTLPPGYSYTMCTVLLIDNSPSQHIYLESTKQAVNAFIDNMNQDDSAQHELALIAYDSNGEPCIVQEMTNDRASLKTALNTLEATRAATDVYSAMLLGLSLWNEDTSSADAEFVQGLLIAITDGNDTSGLHNINEVLAKRDAANLLCDRNKQIITLAIGSNVADDAFKTLCNAYLFEDNGYCVVTDPVVKGTRNFILEKLIAIQERVVACMDSFYWLEYRTGLTSNNAGAHTITIRIDKNANKDADAAISAGITTATLFSGQTDIYIKATNLNPAGDMEFLPVYLSEGESEITRELTAVTYRGDNAPEYTWESLNTSVATIAYDPANSGKATLTVVGTGNTVIRIIDTKNGITRDFVLPVEIIAKAEGYTLTEYNVESHAPWFVDAMFQVNENATGNLVSTLIRDDFVCLEDGLAVDGELQELGMRKHDTMPAPYIYKFKTVLLIDNTPSGAGYVEEMKTAARTFVDSAFPEEDSEYTIKDKKDEYQQEIAILAFDSNGDMYVVQNFSNDPTVLKDSIDTVEEAGGITAFYAAMIDGMDLWDDDYSVNDLNDEFTQGVYVVLTDGYDSFQRFYRFDQVLQARDKGAGDPDKHIIVVGVSADLTSNVNLVELEQLDNFGTPGIYTVADPRAVTSVNGISMLLLEKTMIQIQQQLTAFAKSFYWVEYRSNFKPIAPLDHTLTVSLKNNANVGADGKIISAFSAADFFNAMDNKIYINASAAHPGGEIDTTGFLDFKFYFDGWRILQFRNDYPLKAVTYNADILPKYVWSDPRPNLQVQYNPDNSSQALLILPANPLETDVGITVTDEDNGGVFQAFTVSIKDIAFPAPPVAYYPFNGNVEDESGNDYDGTTIGAVLATDRFNKSKNAYFFDENKNGIALDMFYGPGGESMGDLTVSAWIKTDSSKNMRIVSFNYQYYWELFMAEGKITLASIPFGTADAISTRQAYNDNRWHLITGTMNSANDTMQLFVDGELLSTTTEIIQQGSKVGPQSGFIGCRNDKLDLSFNGLIDDVIIFDYVLNPDQIKTLLETK